jgi:C4-dicarboxylate transporter, DctQ subunit
MLRLLDRLEEIIISLLIALATLITFVSETQRYALSLLADFVTYARAHHIDWLYEASKVSYFFVRSLNLVWSQEVCIIFFVWMAKFGAAYGVRTGIHVGIDVLINKLSPANRKVFIFIGLGAGAFFTAVIGTLGANFVNHMYHTGSTATDVDVPMWIVYLAVPLGSYLMCFRFLQVAFNFARTGELPHHDHGHVEGIEDDAAAQAIAASPLTPKER